MTILNELSVYGDSSYTLYLARSASFGDLKAMRGINGYEWHLPSIHARSKWCRHYL